MSWTKRWRKRLRALARREQVEAELDEELAFHVEMETQKNLRAGMSPGEARRRAVLAFGGLEKFKEEVREARALGWIPGVSLDFKLGSRMLVKHPGLALVGGLGMAVAIAIGAGVFTVLNAFVPPALPLEEGDRVVGIENWDASISNNQRPSLHDFALWREELRTVQDLGAFRNVGRNLIVPGGSAEPVSLAEMTATGFRVARIPPLLGRPLVEEDQREGAPQVVVIGFDAWARYFQSDPAVVGREVRLGSTVHTVVGVMPEGFAFPTSHRLWIPLRADPSRYLRGDAPTVTVFGRLAPGVTLEQAQAELTAIGRRTAAAFPDTHEQIRPRVLAYPSMFMDGTTRQELQVAQFLVSLLLVVVAVNIAVLVYARTATRRGEIAVRTALGASRRRIVAQLFAEAIVLSTAAAAAGLALTVFALRRIDTMFSQLGTVPFWVDFRLSTGTLLYVLGLTLLGAVIVGVVPALQATGRQLQSSLRQLGGGTGVRLGRTWTALIVAQVAFAVAALPAAVHMGREWIRYGFAEPGFAAEEFLSADLAMEREVPPSAEAEAYQREFAARFGDRLAELQRRLASEPGVAHVTFAMQIPGEEPAGWVEVDGVPAPTGRLSDYNLAAGTRSGHEVRLQRMDVDLLETFGVPVLSGRGFDSGDLAAGAAPVIVNRTFVQRVLNGGDPLGRRIRYVGRGGDAPADLELGRWHEVVGVVDDFPNRMQPGPAAAKVYHPVAPGRLHPAHLILRLQGTAPAAFAGRLREITVALDPTLQLRGITPLDEELREQQGGMRLGALAIALLTLSVLLLSAAGIYAMISFTVTRRRREIGIRSALGAQPRRIMVAILSRASAQLAAGLATGSGRRHCSTAPRGASSWAGTGASSFPRSRR